jgi:hypothetical protein
MVDQNSPVPSVVKFGQAVLTAANTPHGQSPSRANSRIPRWRYLLNRDISRLDDIALARITNVKLWSELMERLSGLSDQDAAEVVLFWRRLVVGRKDCFISTAEICMIDAFRALHDKISPMTSGASEYDEIMEVQSIIDGD